MIMMILLRTIVIRLLDAYTDQLEKVKVLKDINLIIINNYILHFHLLEFVGVGNQQWDHNSPP